MNNLSRRQRIEQMLITDPADRFLKYGLAMELAKENQFDQSLAILQELADAQPPYIPAFFMAAQQLAQLQRVAEARQQLVAGIEQATSQQDHHAAREMSEFLDALPLE